MRSVIKRTLALLLLINVNGLHAIEEDVYNGVPQDVKYPHSITPLDNEGFAVGYDETRKAPAWVSYRLFPNPGRYSYERPSRFRTDNRTQSRISHDHYTHSGFDRGHLAPNYAIMTRYGRAGQVDSFLMSNIAPMRPSFNRGIWKNLESLIARNYSNSFEELWVVTGPIYDEDIQRLATGVEVADAFFKIVIDEVEGNPRAQAFVIPHHSLIGSLSNYLTSVDEVEKATGFDFFSELPDNIENKIEAKISPGIWISNGYVKAPEKTTTARSPPTTYPKQNTSPRKEQKVESRFWLNTNSDVRHNSSCRYFHNTKQGRACPKHEGRACGICGG